MDLFNCEIASVEHMARDADVTAVDPVGAALPSSPLA
jgi:hypothetical protein